MEHSGARVHFTLGWVRTEDGAAGAPARLAPFHPGPCEAALGQPRWGSFLKMPPVPK